MNIQIYDNGGVTKYRYTIVIGTAFFEPFMNDNGIDLYRFNLAPGADHPFKQEAIGTIQKRISLNDLPKQIRKLALQKLKQEGGR